MESAWGQGEGLMAALAFRSLHFAQGLASTWKQSNAYLLNKRMNGHVCGGVRPDRAGGGDPSLGASTLFSAGCEAGQTQGGYCAL